MSPPRVGHLVYPGEGRPNPSLASWRGRDGDDRGVTVDRRSPVSWVPRLWALVACPAIGVFVALLQGRRDLGLGDALVSVVVLPAGLAMFVGAALRLRGAVIRRMGLDAAAVGLVLVGLFYVLMLASSITHRLE
jgi:hypothetical protein